MARRDETMLVAANEHGRLISRAARLERVACTVKGHGRYNDLWAICQADFQVLQRWIARHQPERMPVGVNDNLDEVRIVERIGGARERRLIKIPPGRPLPPEHPAEVASMSRQAVSTPLRLEEMLIPQRVFDGRRESSTAPRGVDDIVACQGDEARHACRSKSGDNARCQATPIIPAQDRLFDL